MFLPSLFLSLVPASYLPPPAYQVVFPKKEASFSFRRGYDDGFSGLFFAPVHGLVASQYRAGWKIGASDRKSGRPYSPNQG